jgi:hypothetical protein
MELGKNITSLHNLMSECAHLLPSRNPYPARFTAKVRDTVLREFLAEALRDQSRISYIVESSFYYCALSSRV